MSPDDWMALAKTVACVIALLWYIDHMGPNPKKHTNNRGTF